MKDRTKRTIHIHTVGTHKKSKFIFYTIETLERDAQKNFKQLIKSIPKKLTNQKSTCNIIPNKILENYQSDNAFDISRKYGVETPCSLHYNNTFSQPLEKALNLKLKLKNYGGSKQLPIVSRLERGYKLTVAKPTRNDKENVLSTSGFSIYNTNACRLSLNFRQISKQH